MALTIHQDQIKVKLLSHHRFPSFLSQIWLYHERVPTSYYQIAKATIYELISRGWCCLLTSKATCIIIVVAVGSTLVAVYASPRPSVRLAGRRPTAGQFTANERGYSRKGSEGEDMKEMGARVYADNFGYLFAITRGIYALV